MQNFIKKINSLMPAVVLTLVLTTVMVVVPTEKASASFWSDADDSFRCAIDHAYCDDDPAPVAATQTTTPISGTCYTNAGSLTVGGSATWYASIYGGTGSYSYSWVGTDSLYGNSQSVFKIYNTTGVKTAQVTVTSGSLTKTIVCGSHVQVNSAIDTTTAISGSCYANATSVNTGGSVSWIASVSGGTGSYSYSWNGSDSLSGSGSIISKTYSYSGTKSANVTVTSGSQVRTITCDTNVSVNDYNNNNNNSNLVVSCYPNNTTARYGDSIYWSANVSGGNGAYTYSWSGTDGLWGSQSSITKNYWNTGLKTASLTVYSNGQTVSRTCDNGVSIYDSNYNNNYSNYNNNNYTYPYTYSFDPYSYGSNYNNNNYYSSGYNYVSPLSVSCTANIGSGLSGNTVTWTAVASGGNGSYTYYWNGDDSLVGNTAVVSKTYWNAGLKTASVSVGSNGQSITRTCGNTVSISTRPITVTNSTVDTTGGDYPPVVTVTKTTTKATELVVSCSPNTRAAAANDTVVWVSNALGGTGKYTYSWEGSDGLTGDTNYIAKSYYNDGNKVAVLTVKSGDQVNTKVCGNVTIGDISSSQAASALFSGWTGGLILFLLIVGIILLGFLLYLIIARDRREQEDRKNQNIA
ncbi:MAG: hypothetical protein WCF94_00040 [bacterium]